jgi:hypothetical protein
MASLVSYLKTAAAAVQRPTHKGAQDERQRAARIRGPVGQRNATGTENFDGESTRAPALQNSGHIYRGATQ